MKDMHSFLSTMLKLILLVSFIFILRESGQEREVPETSYLKSVEMTFSSADSWMKGLVLDRLLFYFDSSTFRFLMV